jgi:hypothetical protein
VLALILLLLLFTSPFGCVDIHRVLYILYTGENK